MSLSRYNEPAQKAMAAWKVECEKYQASKPASEAGEDEDMSGEDSE